MPGTPEFQGRDGSSLNTGKGRLRTAHGPFFQQKTLGVGVPNMVTVQVLCQIQLSVRQRLAIKIQHFLKICIHAYEAIIFSINSVHHDKAVSKPSLKTWLSLKHEGWSLSPVCATQNTKPIPICRPAQQAPSQQCPLHERQCWLISISSCSCDFFIHLLISFGTMLSIYRKQTFKDNS